MGSITSAAQRTTQPRPRRHRKEHGVLAVFVGLVLTMYAAIGYGIYIGLAALL